MSVPLLLPAMAAPGGRAWRRATVSRLDGRATAAGQERERLWQRWTAIDPSLDDHAGRRSTDTPVIVLEAGDGTA